eukprot:TRINITY_DN16670_c0_g1_i1.p1 TRINITY_DN16670_c0_g1~~TRINITY_DN16670_c0_g1_i1.p1  ORF type:complete len:525 (+),score=67.30 TRINITY_DN16670_c0_g1_i1:48-1577(+)
MRGHSNARSGSVGGLIPKHSSSAAFLAFSVGFFLVSGLIAVGELEGVAGWLRHGESAGHGIKRGATIMILPECEWVQVLISSYPLVRWDDGMEKYCGSAATIVSINTKTGIVKCRHSDGVLVGWPVVATSILPKYPPPEFLSNRLTRASYHLDRIEKHLSTYHEDKVQNLLKSLGMSAYYKPMVIEGLDRLDLIVAATEEDRKAVGMLSSEWSTLQVEAAKMQQQRDSKVPFLPGSKPGAPTTPTNPSSTAIASPRKLGQITSAHFIHIPKAGGTAFTTALRAVVGCSVEPCLGHKDNHPECEALEGCYGHAPFTKLGVEKRVNRSTMLLALNVRKPVDRLVSAFHHGRREWPCCGLPQREEFKNRLYRASGPDAFTLSTFAVQPATRNCMTKMLIGMECKAPFKLDDAQAQRASDNLELFNMVLIMEYMTESLNLLRCVTGSDALTGDMFKEKVRSGVYTEKGTEEERALIAENNEWDTMLYEKSIKQFCVIYRKHECTFSLPEGLCE